MTPDEHVAQLERDVELFAQHLTEAMAAGVSHAIILPRMMLAFRRTFGEPPTDLALPAWGAAS